MKKILFVLIDGLGAEAASCMGWLAAMTEDGRAHYAVMSCEMPPISRPLYHCIFTGQSPVDSGIVHNSVWTMPHNVPPSIFARAAAAGLCTAAAAFWWVSDLCNRPWEAARDRITDDTHLPIQHGIFYTNEAYPDDQVFLDGESLRTRYAPHLLLIHSSGVDHAGHKHGGRGSAYRNAARCTDMLLAQYAPTWLEAGYTVIVTSDHGMHADAMHNDNTRDVRRVPVWMLGALEQSGLPNRQTQWCGYMARLLGL